MLVLTRKPGEEIIIGGNIRITIVSVRGDRVRIGISAPESVTVDRAEVHERRSHFEVEVAVPADGDSMVRLDRLPTPQRSADDTKH